MASKMAPAKLVAFVSLPLIKIQVYFYDKMNLCFLQKKKKKSNGLYQICSKTHS